MDFDSLPRRDLQFFCKRNKIPANMTNIAMANALKSLEIVEGIDEFVNRSDYSPTSVARNLPSAARTAARTTRRRMTKEESELVTRSCLVTKKSLTEEMDQENRNENTLQDLSVAVKLDVADIKLEEANVSKTPAARSTRKAQAAASSVQRVYSTRRAVKMLEESMADLSLKTNVQQAKKKNQDSPTGSKSRGKAEEAEVISVRDLNDSLEKEWDGFKNDPDLDVLYGDLGDITFNNDSFVLGQEQETSQEDGIVIVNHAASATTITVSCNKESESEQIKNGSEPESEETEYEADPCEDDDDSGDVVNNKQVAFEMKDHAASTAQITVSCNKECESEQIKNGSEPESEETEIETDPSEDDDGDSGEVVNTNKVEFEMEELKSDKDSEEIEAEEEEICESEWSDFEIDDVVVDDIFISEELIDSEAKEAPVSDEKRPISSPFTLTGEAESVSDQNKSVLKLPFAADDEHENKENVVEMVLNNKGEGISDATDSKKEHKKKKTIDGESFKDVSMRQLTKMVKELEIKSKQQHKSLD